MGPLHFVSAAVRRNDVDCRYWLFGVCAAIPKIPPSIIFFGCCRIGSMGAGKMPARLLFDSRMSCFETSEAKIFRSDGTTCTRWSTVCARAVARIIQCRTSHRGITWVLQGLSGLDCRYLKLQAASHQQIGVVSRVVVCEVVSSWTPSDVSIRRPPSVLSCS